MQRSAPVQGMGLPPRTPAYSMNRPEQLPQPFPTGTFPSSPTSGVQAKRKGIGRGSAWGEPDGHHALIHQPTAGMHVAGGSVRTNRARIPPLTNLELRAHCGRP